MKKLMGFIIIFILLMALPQIDSATVSNQTNRVSYTGNGSTKNFAVSFPFHAKTDLVVISTVISTGAQSTLTYTTDYTVSGTADNQGHYPNGGTVNAVTAPASTVTWTIYRDPSLTQNVNLVEGDPLPVESGIESPLDRLTLIGQRFKERLDRSLQQPEGDASNIARIPSKVDRASKYLGFDTLGNPVAMSATSGLSGSINVADIITTSPWVDVRAYGAKGDGVMDDTAAIQAAINSISKGIVSLPCLTFKVTSTIIINSNDIHIIGCGIQKSLILFAPTSNSTVFLINNASTQISYGSIENIGFYSNDSTYTKTAINIVNLQNYVLNNVSIAGSISGSYWSGNNSIGLKIQSVSQGKFSNLQIFADSPLVMGPDPVSGGTADHVHFYDLYLVANGQPVVTALTGSVLTNVTFDGAQAWVKGTYGFYLNDTTSASASFRLSFHNIRTEQGTSASAYMFYINKTSTQLNGLLIDNVYGGTDRNGVYIRNVSNTQISNTHYNGSGTALNADSSVNLISLFNAVMSGTATLTGQTLVWQEQTSYGSLSIPIYGLYDATANNPAFKVPTQIQSTLPTGTAPFSVASTTPNTNLNAYAVTYDNAGSQRINQQINWGTTNLVNGSAVIAFSSTSTYSASTAYVGFAITQGGGGTKPLTVTQTSGTSMTINGLFNELVNWWTQGK